MNFGTINSWDAAINLAIRLYLVVWLVVQTKISLRLMISHENIML